MRCVHWGLGDWTAAVDTYTALAARPGHRGRLWRTWARVCVQGSDRRGVAWRWNNGQLFTASQPARQPASQPASQCATNGAPHRPGPGDGVAAGWLPVALDPAANKCTIGTLTWFRSAHNFVDPIVAIDESDEGEHFLRRLWIA